MPVYQNKKTKLYEYRTYIQNADGSKRQKEKTGFKSERAAKQAEKQMILENEQYLLSLKEKGSKEENKISFLSLWNEYDTFIKLKLKPDSYRCIKNRIINHILPYFKDFEDTNSIKGKDYIKWQSKIQEKGYKYSYNKSIHTAMVSLLNFGIKFYEVQENIASKVGNFKNHDNVPKNVNFWTYEEYQTFISAVHDELYKLLFETLYYTGMRIGECLALNWNDLQNNFISITKTITKEFVNGERLITTPKTKSSIRKIMIDGELLEKLNKYKEYCKTKINFANDWFIFGDLTPMSPTTIERKKNMYCEESNVKKIRIHDFRHSHASLLISQGVPITVVQNRLGHSDSSITLEIYSHMFPSDELKAIQAISSLNALRGA